MFFLKTYNYDINDIAPYELKPLTKAHNDIVDAENDRIRRIKEQQKLEEQMRINKLKIAQKTKR